MTIIGRKTRNLLGRLAIAGGLLSATAAGASAHPFDFDTARMPGFRVLTAEDGAMSATDMVVIEYKGPIAFPMAENLRTIWTAIAADHRYERVLLRLNSPGGVQGAGEDVIAVLDEIRERATLLTLVGDGDMCASMCIPLFIQGERRHASPASIWMFHGATRGTSNIPSVTLTMRYVGYFRERAVGAAFVNKLVDEKILTSAGEYWIAGAQLAAESDLVTTLDANWKPRAPDSGPSGGILSGV